jgi:hypothetical protein
MPERSSAGDRPDGRALRAEREADKDSLDVALLNAFHQLASALELAVLTTISTSRMNTCSPPARRRRVR